jgi:hypothetical protein
MEVVTDPVELAKARAQREKFDRNWAWLQAHTQEAYADANRGRYICIAGEELFVADSAPEAERLGRAKHPDDDGSFVLYVRKERRPIIYAHRR